MNNYEIYRHIDSLIAKYLDRSLEKNNDNWEKDQATARKLIPASAKYYKLWMAELKGLTR